MKTRHERTGRLTRTSRGIAQKKGNIREIVVPTDFSPASKEALKYAGSLAGQLNAKVTLVNIIEPLPTMDTSAVSAVLAHSRDLCETRQSLDAVASRSIAAEQLNATQVLIGRPFEQIIKVAKAVKADLIVLAAQGYNEAGKGILGSTADKLVRLAPCPVLILPK